jgi:hypothetical protein
MADQSITTVYAEAARGLTEMSLDGLGRLYAVLARFKRELLAQQSFEIQLQGHVVYDPEVEESLAQIGDLEQLLDAEMQRRHGPP